MQERGRWKWHVIAEMDGELWEAHQRLVLIITYHSDILLPAGRPPLKLFLQQLFMSEGERKKCLFQFFPLFVSCMTRCGNWDRKQTVGLGFYFLFKCSHCLRQNCDFPPLSAPHKAHLPRCPLQMAIKGICFLKALSWVFLSESII